MQLTAQSIYLIRGVLRHLEHINSSVGLMRHTGMRKLLTHQSPISHPALNGDCVSWQGDAQLTYDLNYSISPVRQREALGVHAPGSTFSPVQLHSVSF